MSSGIGRRHKMCSFTGLDASPMTVDASVDKRLTVVSSIQWAEIYKQRTADDKRIYIHRSARKDAELKRFCNQLT